ncbi:MAG: hypothetical protein ACR2RB_00575 [Gammaproteobacteria bacterium]
MTSGSAKGHRQKETQDGVQELLDRARETSTRQAATTKPQEQPDVVDAASSRFADIAANTFYKIMFDPDADPKQKMESVARALTFAESKDESKARLEEFKAFKEYLQFERKRMAQQIIDLTDTEAFSELKTVYDDLNNALVAFEDRIAPLTEIVDAVYTLRTNGLTFDAFKEIALDKEAEARIAAEREQQQAAFERISAEIRAVTEENAVLSEDKVLFGLGGVRRSSREKMAKNELLLRQKQSELAALTSKIREASSYSLPQSELGMEFTGAKSKLRELLDISSDEHKQRQEGLVTAAQEFIDTTETRVSTISEHFSGMDKQIDNLTEANYSMREIYAILNDATKHAHNENEGLRETLQPTGQEEGDIEAMNRERQKRELENYISALSTSAVDTTTVLAELTNSSHRIKSMKDGNEQQISKTRQLHSSGVAGVADQLSTVLQAVSAAALGESSEMARMSLERMTNKTQDLTQKEVIRLALGTHEQNTELTKALQDLEQYGDVIRTATDITREGLAETKDLLGKLEETAKDVQEDVKESIAVVADVVAGKGGSAPGEAEKAPPTDEELPNPFKLGRE